MDDVKIWRVFHFHCSLNVTLIFISSFFIIFLKQHIISKHHHIHVSHDEKFMFLWVIEKISQPKGEVNM